MLELNLNTFLLVTLIIFLFYVVHSWLQKPLEYRKLSSRIPSLTNSLWSEIKFSLNIAVKQPHELLQFLTEIFLKNGPVVHLSLAGRQYVLLNNPDDIKILLSDTKYINKGPEYEMMKPWLNEGLLLSSGSKWQNRRKLLTNTFHFKTIEMYNSSINKHSKILIKKLLEESLNNEEICLKEYVTLCSLDMICETIMGIEINAQDGQSIEYVSSIKQACRSITERIFKFWLWNDLIFKISGSGRSFNKSIQLLHNFTDNVIKNKRILINNSRNHKPEIKYAGKHQNKSFLDILLHDLNKFTDKDIQEEVDTFLFEGHDTSSISMIMTLILLGLHPDIQEKARDELCRIFEDSDRDATMEDLNAMKYLEVIIKESLRLYPSVPAITRQLQTTLNIKNFSIPPMTTVFIMPYALHRSEEIYYNAEEFIPERFFDEDMKSKFLFGYLPFSAGPRNCIGQKYAMNQMKTVISTILRQTRIETLGNKNDIKISMQLITRIESLPKVRFYKIQ